MGVLTTDERNKLSDADFALPGRRYPIHNADHAREALAMVSKHGTTREKSIVQQKVKARFPEIGIS